MIFMFYMVEYVQQDKNKLQNAWIDNLNTKNILFISADNEDEAISKMNAAIDKLNQYALGNCRYINLSKPKEILAISASHNLARNTTFITGIWDKYKR